MRYWGILAGKLALAAAVLYGIWWALYAWYVPPEEISRWGHSPFAHDLSWTTLMFFYNLVVQGVLAAILIDQRYRCRTCGRRLRMPVQTGRYGQMLLFGRPKTEYICAFGHGTLKVPQLHVTGREPDDWKGNDDDIWKELYALDGKKQE